jgi:hypothetical protein
MKHTARYFSRLRGVCVCCGYFFGYTCLASWKMHPFARIKKALRGNVPLTAVAKELVRLARVRSHQRRERREMDSIDAAPARLSAEFARLSPQDLQQYFLNRKHPRLWASDVAEAQKREFHVETTELIAAAEKIVDENTWEIGGFGEIKFDQPNYWRCDPLTGYDWRLDYHADVPIYPPGGPDIRVLWELERSGHLLILARAFAVTGDERYAETFFRHLEEWAEQNPYARGANWRSPMDVIMRAVNVVAAFELIKNAVCCTPERVALVLKTADTHCRFTLDNNEFSCIATGNHYITNVAGLFFVATLLPELEHAEEWQQFGLSGLLSETKKQILPDGADWESSTGYHKFVTEMLLTCLLLAKRNGIEVAEEHRDRCRDMLRYSRAVIRPDGGMPLVGDCDGSQFLPTVRRDADDAKYLLDIAAGLWDDAEFKINDECSPEVLWLFGSEGGDQFNQMLVSQVESSQFPNAGSYILRDDDLYVMLNANDVGLNGRGSHSHNDALSIEVSALGHAWILDPGSYVYNLDREARHRFRSTAAHSTLMIDGREQNAISVDEPFVSSNDAQPKLLDWKINDHIDRVSAEHYGYSPIIHRRTVELDKRARALTISDEVSDPDDGEFVFSFHLAPDIEVRVRQSSNRVTLIATGGCSLTILSDVKMDIQLDAAAFSTHYGRQVASKTVRYKTRSSRVRWLLVPVAETDELEERLFAALSVTQNKA